MIFVSSSSSRRRSKASSVSVSVCSSGGILRGHTPHSTHTEQQAVRQSSFWWQFHSINPAAFSLPHCHLHPLLHSSAHASSHQWQLQATGTSKQTNIASQRSSCYGCRRTGLCVCVCVVPSVESSSTGTDAPRLVCSSSAPLSVRRRLSASQSACLFVSPDHLVNLSVSRLQLSQLSQ